MSGYQYTVVLYREDGAPIGHAAVATDFEPALEWARFLGMRLGRVSPVLSADGGEIAPIWDPHSGEPFIAGFHAAVAGGNGREFGCDIPIQYFRGAARNLAARYVQDGLLKEKERFLYGAAALPRPDAPTCAAEAPTRCTVRRLEQRLPLNDLSLDRLLGRAEVGKVVDPVDMPVFIPREVLEEAAVLTRQAGSLETGGILVGWLHRDASCPEIFAEVTAQIPAQHTQSDLTRLTFTADTWTAARAAIEARGRGELMLGWWHSHSYMKEGCKECGHQKPGCQGRAEFFSTEDCSLHRTVSHRAFCVGLVVSNSPCEGLTEVLFGWRHGMIAHRGYHILPSPAASSVAAGDAGGQVHDATK